jgi:formamidopyrimidine-DNA glycosylase
MPELPDVQVFREYLDATALHQRIDDVTVSGAGELLHDVSARTLRDRLKGRSLAGTRRRGKHLFAKLSGNGWLRLHFGMTGELAYFKRRREAPDHVRLRLDFANGYHLAYRNVRKLGEIGLVDDVVEFVEAEGLGPDALDPELDLGAFREALGKRRGSVKGALMNQEVVAGIGNVYADEILLAAGGRPPAREARNGGYGAWDGSASELPDGATTTGRGTSTRRNSPSPVASSTRAAASPRWRSTVPSTRS